MAKRPLGRDAQGIQKQMRLPNYLGDGATSLALNSLSGLTGVIVYFYTDKVGIAAAAAGTIMFIAKIVDALTDLGMGWIMDTPVAGGAVRAPGSCGWPCPRSLRSSPCS
ncbi:hypothetical protein BW737_003175 [Actinomyces ruminis]|uniref:Uncharacterized protein n=1 Tax=Actinomyces ruminis TaxID=1937003 RepID=A0ABX4MD34_9ACTO|nr:MFS transporter [Actinomyces ruminis]PHP53375.1 hypothetical protein BW737_003175 [Actinomyces ruminis]